MKTIKILLTIYFLVAALGVTAQTQLGSLEKDWELANVPVEYRRISKPNPGDPITITKTANEIYERTMSNGDFYSLDVTRTTIITNSTGNFRETVTIAVTNFYSRPSLAGSVTFTVNGNSYVIMINQLGTVDQGQPAPAISGTISDNAYTGSEVSTYNKIKKHQRAYYRNGAYKTNRKFAYVSANMLTSVAYRCINFKNPGTEGYYSEYADRVSNEKGLFAAGGNLQLGITFKRNHTVGISGSLLRQGFSSVSDTLDWNTGYSSYAGTVWHNRFSYAGLGIFYNHTSYQHMINPVFEAGIDYMFMDKFLNRKDKVKTAGLNNIPNQLIGRIGYGISIRPCYGFDVKIMPCFVYNFTEVFGNILSTRLYNVGITTGIAWRIDTYKM